VNLTYQPVKILVGATWRHRPHNFLAVGAIAPIAPMESAPMANSFFWRTKTLFQVASFFPLQPLPANLSIFNHQQTIYTYGCNSGQRLYNAATIITSIKIFYSPHNGRNKKNNGEKM